MIQKFLKNFCRIFGKKHLEKLEKFRKKIEGVRLGGGGGEHVGGGVLVGAGGSLGPRPGKTAQKPLQNRPSLA